MSTTLKPCHYSIDILTDGSEGTGPGIFLSVHRSNTHNSVQKLLQSRRRENDKKDIPDDDVIARYALAGIGDCTSRLAADQKYKLKHVKAVFCHGDTSCFMGIMSLLLALKEAGSASLTVVAPNDLDPLMKLMTENMAFPTVQLCQVPSCSSSNKEKEEEEEESPDWWQVYQDEHICVHATSVPSHCQDSDMEEKKSCLETFFVFTLAASRALSETPFSFLVAPTGECVSRDLLKHLPILDKTQPLECSFVITTKKSPSPKRTLELELPHYWLEPQDHDPNLLSRAYRQSMFWNQSKVGRYFPFQHSCLDKNFNGHNPPITLREDYQLTTGCQLVWGRQEDGSDSHLLREPPRAHWTVPVVVQQSFHASSSNGEISEESRNLLDALQAFLDPPQVIGSLEDTVDDNEIELSDDDDDDEEQVEDSTGNQVKDNDTKPYFPTVAALLVLGTGCAKPSPHRGASGHVLLGETSHGEEWAIAFEVGEGFVTQWNRHSPTRREIASISIIWISHAHWDHYGGLVPLLLAIESSRTEKMKVGTAVRREEGGPSLKRQRQENLTTPIVFAPRKVLRLLHATWPKSHHLFFQGFAHEDPSFSGRNSAWDRWNRQFYTAPIVFWNNIQVDHSCRCSFGFVMGMQISEGSRPFVFAFSGDTRPCSSFVHGCQRYDAVDFLIHEATFDEEEREMSIKKKHSTIAEAMEIASRVSSRRTLLTHFSQRYNSTRSLTKGSNDVGMSQDALASKFAIDTPEEARPRRAPNTERLEVLCTATQQALRTREVSTASDSKAYSLSSQSEVDDAFIITRIHRDLPVQ